MYTVARSRLPSDAQIGEFLLGFINRMKKEPSVFRAGFSAFPPLFGLGASVFTKRRLRALRFKHGPKGIVAGHVKLSAACPTTVKSARELYFDFKVWPISKKYATYRELRDTFGLTHMQIMKATSAAQTQNKQYFGIKYDTPSKVKIAGRSLNKYTNGRPITNGRPVYYRLKEI